MRSAVMIAVLAGTAACSGGEDHVRIGSADLCTTRSALSADDQVGSGLPDKTLALTFDDGPAEPTAELSTYLKKASVAATFFINGAYVAGRESTLRQQVADGHLIGNHTHTHRGMIDLSSTERVSEIEKTDAIIASMAAPAKLFFRPPFGAWNEEVKTSLDKSTMNKYVGPIGWDIGAALTKTTAADWDCWDEANGSRTVKECGDLYLKEIRDKRRGIVLMHDGPPESNGQTLAMMKYILPILTAEGYEFVRLDQVPLRSGTAPATGGAAPCQR